MAPVPLLHHPRQMAFDWWDSPPPSSQTVATTPAASSAAPAQDGAPGAAAPHTLMPGLLQGQPDASPTPERLQAVPDMLHPQANRHIVLEQQVVGYLLVRARRRTVGMRIAEQGLEVAAPHWVARGEVERILQQKARWIVRKLRERQLQHAAPERQPLHWQHGMLLEYAGQPLRVHLAGAWGQGIAPQHFSPSGLFKPRQRQALLHQVQWLQAGGGQPHATLHVPLPPDAPPDALRDLVLRWYMEQALAQFAARIAVYEPVLGVRHRHLALSNAASRWGSATSGGVIRLHWRLLQFDPALMDYVIVHELSHLREMNHSPRFWQVVASALPDYATARARLKSIRLQPW